MREEEIMALIILFRKLTKTELRYNTGIQNNKTQPLNHSLSSQSKATPNGNGDKGINILINLELWISGTHQYNLRHAFVVLAFSMIMYPNRETKP